MTDLMQQYGWHIIQLLTLIIVTLVRHSFNRLWDEITGLRKETNKLSEDIKAEHELFKLYVQEEKCKMHREVIEKRIHDSENRVLNRMEKIQMHCLNYQG